MGSCVGCQVRHDRHLHSALRVWNVFEKLLITKFWQIRTGFLSNVYIEVHMRYLCVVTRAYVFTHPLVFAYLVGVSMVNKLLRVFSISHLLFHGKASEARSLFSAKHSEDQQNREDSGSFSISSLYHQISRCENSWSTHVQLFRIS